MNAAPSLAAGQAALSRRLKELGRVLVAFSGGVDSTLVLRAALDALPREAALAATLVTPYVSRAEVAAATRLADALGARHATVAVAFPEVLRHNPEDRCYLCKGRLFTQLRELAAAEGLDAVVDGTNADDIHDDRPGLRALRELGVVSPLLEAGLGKAAIRAISRDLGLATWDKPAAPCLLTRLPHGALVSEAVLARVEAAEAVVAAAGFPVVRVRAHDDLARIAVPRERLADLVAAAQRLDLVGRLTALGFRQVTLDLAGYRSGDRPREAVVAPSDAPAPTDPAA